VARRARQSTTRRELVSNQILEQSAALFAERGVSGTSLQEVADALQISRTALYHYIGGKDELLATLVRGITQETAAALEQLAADESTAPLERLRLAIVDMVVRIASSPSRFRLLLMSESELDEKTATEHRRARRRTLEALERIVAAGVDAGALRPADQRTAAFALLGMCNWVAWWYRPDRDEQPPERVAETIAEIALAGLRAGDGRAATNGDAVGHALQLLREDLTLLERAVGARRAGAA